MVSVRTINLDFTKIDTCLSDAKACLFVAQAVLTLSRVDLWQIKVCFIEVNVGKDNAGVRFGMFWVCATEIRVCLCGVGVYLSEVEVNGLIKTSPHPLGE